jgi:hypothetical protein
LNSQTAQIQAIISEIDEVLSKPSPRLPWVASVATTQQRQVLARVRDFLASLEQELATPARLPIPTIAGNTADVNQQLVSQQIVQTVAAEMKELRTSLTGALHSDIQALRQEQQALLTEIKQLEARRQYHQSLAQQQSNQQKVIGEFLQALMNRLESHLTTNVTENFANLETRVLNSVLLAATSGSELSTQVTSTTGELTVGEGQHGHGELPLLTPAQRLEQMRLLQIQCDRLLMSLDSNLQVVFEALQRNLKSYQESLSQGLERMHTLGQQGEAMFAALVNHLAAELGREASSYVQVIPQETSLETEPPKPPLPQEVPQTQELPAPLVTEKKEKEKEKEKELASPFAVTETPLPDQEKFPYAGTEVAAHPPVSRSVSAQAVLPLPSPPAPVEVQESPPEKQEEMDDLYQRLFSPTQTPTEEYSPSLEPFEARSTPDFESPSEWDNTSESLDDFMLAEDSEFVTNKPSADIPLETEDFFAKTGNDFDIIEKASWEAPSPRISTSEDSKKVNLDNLFGETTPPENSGLGVSLPTHSIKEEKISLENADSDISGSLESLTDDFFEPASKDENLLPIEVTDLGGEQALVLDTGTLQLLQDDLYSLEGLEATGIIDSFEGFTPEIDDEFTPNQEEETTTGSSVIEVTTLEDLFADISNTPPLGVALQFAIEEPGEIEIPTQVNSDFTNVISNLDSSELDFDKYGMTLEDILDNLTEAEAKPITLK